MITEDDARTTLELPDRYIIAPAGPLSSFEPDVFERMGAKLVADAFRYASNTNDHWLSSDELRSLLEAGD